MPSAYFVKFVSSIIKWSFPRRIWKSKEPEEILEEIIIWFCLLKYVWCLLSPLSSGGKVNIWKSYASRQNLDPELYSEPHKTSNIELFAKITAKSWNPLVFAKSSIVGVWQGSKYFFAYIHAVLLTEFCEKHNQNVLINMSEMHRRVFPFLI